MSDVGSEAAPVTSKTPRSKSRGSFIWYELITPDPEGAKAFYDRLVGWNIGPAEPDYQDYRMIGRSDGGFAGGLLPLSDEMREHGVRPIWLGYVCVDDVERTIASIEDAGGKALMPPMDVANVGRIAMVSDPQGARFYVMKPIPPAKSPDAESDVFSPAAEQRVGWNELSTSDPASARQFYVDQFGWGADEFMDMGPMGEYRFIERNGTRIGAMCGLMPGQQPRWRYYFRVGSISKAKAVAEAQGGTIRMAPHQVPTGDWILIGSDPQGAEFALVGGE